MCGKKCDYAAKFTCLLIDPLFGFILQIHFFTKMFFPTKSSTTFCWNCTINTHSAVIIDALDKVRNCVVVLSRASAVWLIKQFFLVGAKKTMRTRWWGWSKTIFSTVKCLLQLSRAFYSSSSKMDSKHLEFYLQRERRWSILMHVTQKVGIICIFFIRIRVI